MTDDLGGMDQRELMVRTLERAAGVHGPLTIQYLVQCMLTGYHSTWMNYISMFQVLDTFDKLQ